ncbi:MAG: phytase [Bacteroidales bacterium]|nr:phytase [Bacteroidales bacterium]
MKGFQTIAFLVLSVLMLSSCGSISTGGEDEKEKKAFAEENGFYLVEAEAETAPVESPEDAADDIAIWYNTKNPEASTIIGTNKQQGLVVYNLDGKEMYNYQVGKINNVDIHTKFNFGGDSITIVGATNRTLNTINFWKVNTESGELEELPLSNAISPKTQDVYGFTFYRSITAPRPEFKNKFYAISIGTDGRMEQWELMDDGGKLKARYARIVKFDTQCEGLVADDETGNLFVGEEAVGIWKISALPAGGDKKELIADVAKLKIQPDIEGLTIYYGAGGKGYLLASSQGNNSYAVFTRDDKNKYLGSFMISSGGGIDGTSDTDGIDVLNLALGSDFPDGVFIAQDGSNYDGENLMNQNFKLVDWKEIAGQFKPWLLIDNSYMPQKVVQ